MHMISGMATRRKSKAKKFDREEAWLLQKETALAFSMDDRKRRDSITGKTREKALADRVDVEEEAANEIQRWAMQSMLRRKRFRAKSEKERLLNEWAAIKVQSAWKRKVRE